MAKRIRTDSVEVPFTYDSVESEGECLVFNSCWLADTHYEQITLEQETNTLHLENDNGNCFGKLRLTIVLVDGSLHFQWTPLPGCDEVTQKVRAAQAERLARMQARQLARQQAAMQ